MARLLPLAALALVVAACGSQSATRTVTSTRTVTVRVASSVPVQTVAVPYVVGIREPHASAKVKSAGLTVVIARAFSTAQPKTYVYDQEPKAGNRINKGSQVTIYVSEGPPP
jgi:beta-lactam-binding protein with PASTA domain